MTTRLDDPLAVWLYGSCARGEADPDETHHDRRRIRSFFFQEVDRDKIVLAGGRLDSAEFR